MSSAGYEGRIDPRTQAHLKHWVGRRVRFVRDDGCMAEYLGREGTIAGAWDTDVFGGIGVESYPVTVVDLDNGPSLTFGPGQLMLIDGHDPS